MKFKLPFQQMRNSFKEDVVARSSRAVCGTFEREVIVNNNKVFASKARLKSRGFIIIGTGSAGPNSTKIWFNPAGVNI